MKIDVDFSQISQFKRDLQRVRRNVNKFRLLYFKYLQDHLKIGNMLQENIKVMIYQDGKDNEWYQRTRRLLDAVRVKKEGDQLVLFMDDNFLRQGHEYQTMSKETGYDPSAHAGGNADKSYAERVEEGYDFSNIVGKDSSIPPRRYFKTTLDNIENELDKLESGQGDIRKILQPLFKVFRE